MLGNGGQEGCHGHRTGYWAGLPAWSWVYQMLLETFGPSTFSKGKKKKKKLGKLMDLATGERGGKTQYKPKVRNSKSVTPKEE